jgi:hypothetical protein
MSDQDRETQAAADALVQRLRDRDEETSDEWLAAEYLAWLRMRGWSPPPPAANWRRASGDSRVPDAGRSGGADYLAAKAAKGWAGATGGQPVLPEGRDP